MSLNMVGLILTAVLIPLAVTEFSDWCPWLARRLVRWSARRLGDARASARYEEEWLANLNAVPGKISPLVSALGYLAAVPNMRRTLDHGPRAAISRPRLLPVPISPVVTGQTRELAALDSLLARQRKEYRSTSALIVGISGMPGVGKTALALHWAHKVKDRFPDGNLYADLRSYSSYGPLPPVDILGTFLQAIGVQSNRIPDGIDGRVFLFRDLVARRRMLIVLDDAASFDQIRPFLSASPQSVVLVTSRRRLDMPSGAHTIALDTLSLDEATILLRKIVGAERVDAEPHTAIELVRSCACLPLAIHVAAGQLCRNPDWTINHLVDRLLAPRESDEIGDAGKVLNATVDLSYQALPADAQHLFRHLGALPNSRFGHRQAALLAHTTTDEAKRLLDILGQAQLIAASPQDDLYRLHDQLLSYANQLLLKEDTPCRPPSSSPGGGRSGRAG